MNEPLFPASGTPGDAWSWMFSRREPASSLKDILVWWEVRRIGYNAIVFTAAAISLPLYVTFVLIGSGGDDIGGEPFSLFVAPFVVIPVNIAYSLGEFAELALRVVRVRNTGPLLMKLGVGLSLFLVTLPATGGGIALIVVMAGRLV